MADQDQMKEILEKFRKDIFDEGMAESGGGPPLEKVDPEELWREELLEEQADQERVVDSQN